MAHRYKTILDAPIHQQPDMHTLLALLTDAEDEFRIQNKSDRYLRQSRLRYDAVPEHNMFNRKRTGQRIWNF